MLKHKNLSFYYHPGTIVLVDDQPNYLRSMLTAVDYAADCLGFRDPNEALLMLNGLSQECLALGGANQEHLMNMERLGSYLESEQRFKLVTTVIVDYNMPGMTGLDFCRKLTSPYIRKIMLTGDASTDLAVQAFNEGIIDNFFMKSSDQAVVDLNNAVLNAQFNYFATQTDLFKESVDKKYLPDFLNNDALIHFLLELLHSGKCSEFYFLNYEGDVLLINRAGHMQLLMLRSEKAMKDIAGQVQQMYLDEPIESLKHIVDDFQKYDLIAASDTIKKGDLSTWSKLVYPATMLNSSSGKVYYALADIAKSPSSNYFDKSFALKSLNSFEGLFEVR